MDRFADFLEERATAMEVAAEMWERQASEKSASEKAHIAETFAEKASDDVPLAAGEASSPRSDTSSSAKPQTTQESAAAPTRSASHRISHFISASEELSYDSRERSCAIRALAAVVDSGTFNSISMCIIVYMLVLMVLDTDARAYHPSRGGEGEHPEWVTLSMDVCFAIYFMEFLARLVVEGRGYFRRFLNVMDVIAVLAGSVEYLMTWIGEPLWGVGIFSLARVCRLGRLARFLRLLAGSAELRKLLQIMSECFKTLFWSVILLLLVMTIWAVVTVETINPYVQELSKQGHWEGCERCSRAYASVYEADLTLFSTVVAGDSWGVIALPVMEAYPHTTMIFMGALMTLVFGVLNLIVAVIVDVAAEKREKDIDAMAQELEHEEMKEKTSLERMFRDIDLDGSKSVSYDELLAGAKKVRDFANWLRVLDVDSEDLYQLFQMVDEDGSGEIDPQEFVNAMYRMKHTESRTAVKLVKHMVAKLDSKQDATTTEMTSKLQELETCIHNSFKKQGEQFRKSSIPKEQFDSQSSAMKSLMHSQEAALVQQFDSQSSAMKDWMQSQEAALVKRLQEQTELIQRSCELALARASEVAMEAAREASEHTLREVRQEMGSPTGGQTMAESAAPAVGPRGRPTQGPEVPCPESGEYPAPPPGPQSREYPPPPQADGTVIQVTALEAAAAAAPE